VGQTKQSPIGRIWRRPSGCATAGSTWFAHPLKPGGDPTLAAYDTALDIVGAEGQMA
jgi:hypothetical protein